MKLNRYNISTRNRYRRHQVILYVKNIWTTNQKYVTYLVQYKNEKCTQYCAYLNKDRATITPWSWDSNYNPDPVYNIDPLPTVNSLFKILNIHKKKCNCNRQSGNLNINLDHADYDHNIWSHLLSTKRHRPRNWIKIHSQVFELSCLYTDEQIVAIA